MNSILVVGLATVDLIYYLEKLPNKGIKYVSKKQIMSTGGNASNASIAISRLGGSVTFVSKIGNDFFGNYISFIPKILVPFGNQKIVIFVT